MNNNIERAKKIIIFTVTIYVFIGFVIVVFTDLDLMKENRIFGHAYREFGSILSRMFFWPFYL